MEENDRLVSGNMGFFCNNQRIYSKSTQSLAGGIFTLLLIIIPTILFYVYIPTTFKNTPSVVLIYIFSIAAFLLVILLWFDTATSSPGYLNINTSTEEDFNKTEPYVTISDQKIMLKYCQTCKTVRDVRSMHCSLCGYCIKKHDHHCAFVSNCIGENNNNKFVYFLCSVVLHALCILIPSLMTVSSMKDMVPKVYYNMAMFLSVYSGLFFFGILAFLIFHLYLIARNRTTNEYIRNQYDAGLFDKGCVENFKEVFMKINK
jgi:palmitoyltransferase ZDHHC9/14/18